AKVTYVGNFKHYQAPNIDIFVGDIFEFSAMQLGHVDAIDDRASFVALPESMRAEYTEHMAKISASASQLLITYEYDKSILSGPPFACTAQQLMQYYELNYALTTLSLDDVEGGLKGIDAKEFVCLLQKR
ncbi:thiopurine S-methyltransferase, partial [Psychromonas sp. PRT-SC03]